eukprot:scaffold66960_cov46-Attheya_sp.AAC.1
MEKFKTVVTIYCTTGSVLFLTSICLIVHILQSHDDLSMTYHWLVVFELSVTDILSSLMHVLVALTMVPKELDYLTPSAQGNVVTCTIQGFLLLAIPMMVWNFYNYSICFYYLAAIIQYNKKDGDYIQKKLEPWFHGCQS